MEATQATQVVDAMKDLSLSDSVDNSLPKNNETTQTVEPEKKTKKDEKKTKEEKKRKRKKAN